MMGLPANVGFGRVTGRLIRAILDGPIDPDTEPDGVPIEGAKVTFTASVNRVVNRTATPPVSIFIDPVTVVTNGDGILVSPDGTEGVTLVASDDADLDPSGWTYKVTMTAPRISTLSWSITVPEGSVQDLATAIPVPSSPGSQLAAWQAVVAEITGGTDGLEALVDQAAASAGVAQAAASTASTARDQAQEARSGAESAAASAGAARDQAATNATTLNTWFLRGSGSPLGVVTPASAGVQYVDTAQTCGARVWISTGTGSTSWKVVDGDTGRRILEPVVPLQEGRFAIQRINDTILLYVVDVRVFLEQASKDTRVLNIPPLFDVTQKFVSGFSLTAPYFWRGDIRKEEGVGQYLNFGSESTARGYCRDTCVLQALNSQWPTTLPGTPA